MRILTVICMLAFILAFGLQELWSQTSSRSWFTANFDVDLSRYSMIKSLDGEPALPPDTPLVCIDVWDVTVADKKITFDGNVSSLYLRFFDYANPSDIESCWQFLDLPTSLRSLFVETNGRISARFWNQLGALSHLETLSIRAAEFDPDEFSAIRTASKLSSLRVDCHGLRSRARANERPVFDTLGLFENIRLFDTIGKLPQLTSLWVDLSKVPATALQRLKSNSKLQEFHSRHLTDDGVATLCEAAPNLTLLDIHESTLISDLCLPFIASLKFLEILDVGLCPQIGSLGFAFLTSIRTLRKLSIEGCNSAEYPSYIPSGGREWASSEYRVSAKDIKQFEKLSSLTHLCLASIPAVNDEVIAHVVRRLPLLCALDLRNCVNMTSKGVGLVATATNLRCLMLGCEIDTAESPESNCDCNTETFIKLLSKCESLSICGRLPFQNLKLPEAKCESILRLSLCRTGLDDKVLAAIVSNCPSLQSLDLSLSQSGELCMAAIVKRERLQELRMRGCSESLAGLFMSLLKESGCRYLDLSENEWVTDSFLKNLGVLRRQGLLVAKRTMISIGASAEFCQKTGMGLILH